MRKPSILVTGATGQIGSVLLEALQARHGADRVLATDIRAPRTPIGAFETLDILDRKTLFELVGDYQVTQIYHLAAILSAKGEQQPQQTWEINMNGLFNVLEVSRQHDIRLFFPSSIAVFGPDVPKEATPQDAPLRPTTVYGISKAAGENWCQYYHHRYQLDVRSLRYPGIISYQSMPGGGTTDYAVEIFHAAVRGDQYQCFLGPDTRLPMMYMPDAIRATLELMEAPADQLQVRTSYNLAGISFTPAEIAAAIQRHLPDFKISYQPDFRQAIADSWPAGIDDQTARREWGWRPEYDLEEMTRDMILHLQEQYHLALS